MKKSNRYIDELTTAENAHLEKLHQIVKNSLDEEELLSRKIMETPADKSTFGERLADRVAEFGGSWTFIIAFGLVLAGWIGLNSWILAARAYDPYPYILLNLILSCIAALQAPVIMMSQNRQEAKDRQRAENDYLINLKSEIEIRHLHEKMDLSLKEQYRHLCDIQQRQIELLEVIEKKLERLGKS